MNVAVASDGKQVSGHFGHCEGFTIFACDGNAIASSNFVPNPGHKPGFLPNFLHEKDVDVIISGGMGQGAIDIFNAHDIEVIVGATGDAEGAVAAYLAGNLKSTGSVCHEHQHEGHCND